jgi:hypothetical protein
LKDLKIRREIKIKKQNKRETCSQNMMTVIQTLSPFFSASSNSLLHLFFRKRATINNLSKKSTRPKVGILTHDSAIRWIGCAVSLLLLLGQEKCTRERVKRVEESKGFINNSRQKMMMMMDVIVYPAGMSPIRVVVLGDAFVTDSQIPGRVSLVCYAVVVDAVVGKRLDFRQVTVKRK